MAVTEEALRHVGIQISSDQLEDMVLEALTQMRPVRTEAVPSQEFTPAETDALVRGGFALGPVQPDEPEDPVARTVALHAALLASGLSVTEAARLLGVNPSRIRQRLAARTLYGVKTAAGWRLPAFQFDQGRGLPGIEDAFPCLDPGLHPVAVYSWFTEPDPDLLVGDVQVSPRDWLRMGNEPSDLAAIAAAL